MKFKFTIDDQLMRLIEHARGHWLFFREPYCGEGWGTPEQRATEPCLMLWSRIPART